ncbi:MAG: DALR anticodon-binding domain-containing protein [Nostoc sp. S4]|nr:DALR anticodon-binding domain-containing protein [Nostoc sp. S4]
MCYKIQLLKYTSLKQLLYECISEFLSINTENIKNRYIEGKRIPLHKDRNNNKILYTSSVALQVLDSQNRKAMELAKAIAFHLSATSGDVFNVEIVPPGWIHFELTDSALGTWLQSLAVGKGEVGSGEMGREFHPTPPTLPMPNLLFPVQYAHARCCSLVLLAHREGLIQLREPLASSSPIWSVISPNPIPWLNCNGRLRLNHPDERRLISKLVGMVDNKECPNVRSSVKWEKAALNLSQAFENFWCNCRIWGEVKIVSPEVAQARLGLLMATQSVLKFVLEENLGIFAPLEL